MTTIQAVPYSAGRAFITLIRTADGAPVDPPQALAVEGIQDISWDDKNTLKSLHGEGAYAVRIAGGKKTLSLSLTISELSGKHLNALCYGKTVEQRMLKVNSDRHGFTVPASNATDLKIANVITLNLARVDSVTGVKIAGVAATTTTAETIASGKYKMPVTGEFQFSADDVGKTLEITYVSNGTTLVSNLKVPKKQTFNLKQYTRTNNAYNVSYVNLTPSTATMIKLQYGLTSATPDAGKYRQSNNGSLVFNPAQTGAVTLDHNTDNQVNIKTEIAVLPTAAYGAYIDPPSASVWTGNVSVVLKNDFGTAMTGVALDGPLTSAAAPLTTSGTFHVDAKGYYLFHSADVGDTVTVTYTTDYQFVTMTPTDDGVWTRDLGVRTQGGIALTRVALTSPLSLEHNQYAVSDAGVYYFDQSNGGDTLFINYQYEVTGQGQTIVVDNNKIGEAPTLMLDILYELDGEMMTVAFERVKPKGTGVSTKQEDFAGMKFEFEAQVNRETGVVYTVSTGV